MKAEALHRSLRTHLRGANAFPRPAAARMVFVDLRRSPSLDALRDALEEALHDLGVAQAALEYRPHLTLIRLRFQRRLSRLQDWFERQHKIQNRSFWVSHFDLYESVLKSGGARHRVLETFHLGESSGSRRT